MSTRITRRQALSAAGASAACLFSKSLRATTSSELYPVVETTQGKVRGQTSGAGIRNFKGIRYGADTSGRNRFLPPQKPPSWSGIREAFDYGNIAPQMPFDRRSDYGNLIMFDIQPGGMGEDCLVLNLWTPTTGHNAKRPVLVHLHGGGFYGGSGNSPGFDGEMLARFGDCVVLTINHRLGAFGYMSFAEMDAPDEFAASGEAGMLDIVAALHWVKENIAVFGGDPGRVLVFGQSGGGTKTSHLLAMPSAQGLFHRAGVMSGSTTTAMLPADAAKATRALLTALDMPKLDLRRLQSLPFEDVLAAQGSLEAAMRAKGEAPRTFTPVLDGTVLPRHPFSPDAPAISADIPMIVSTVLDERAYRLTNFNLDEAGLRKFLDERAGGRMEQALKLYREEDPNASPFILQARIDTDMTFRRQAYVESERKAAQGRAPVWTYLWKVPSPAFGGRYGSPHGTDVGPSLHDIRGGLNGPSAENLALADQLASAWVSFAATGDPNNPKTPHWPAFDLEKRATMIWDRPPHVENDPRRAIREFWGA